MSDLMPGHAIVSRRVSQPGTSSPTATTQFAAVGAQTEHDFGLFEYVLAGNSAGASPHYHKTFSETFYVLDGELEVLNGAEWLTAGPGDLVYVPRSSVHGFRNSAADEARFLIIFTPGNVPREEYFKENHARRAAGVVLTDAERDEFARRFDQYNVR